MLDCRRTGRTETITTPEQAIKRDLKRAIELRGGFWSCVQGGVGSKPGDPDIVACIKGRYIGIEAKTPEGRLSDVQKHRRDQILQAGGLYATIRSVEALTRFLDENGL